MTDPVRRPAGASAWAARRLYVSWRRPDGLIVPIGRLDQVTSDHGTLFRFVYLKAAMRHDDFAGLPGLPEFHRAYESDTLFSVFANRLMPRERPDYGAFVDQLDLSVEADPFEVLGRSEGVRATDRIEVFPAPEASADGDLTTVFFARGIRHLTGASEAVDNVEAGDELFLTPQPTNEVNPRALLLDTRTGESVGRVPDYLLELIEELRGLNGNVPRITAEHVNPVSVAPHLRLLCRVAATWPARYEPFSGPDFDLAAGAGDAAVDGGAVVVGERTHGVPLGSRVLGVSGAVRPRRTAEV